ncbi:hypothetical protein COOONC_15399 [Cooperia oncophora]
MKYSLFLPLLVVSTVRLFRSEDCNVDHNEHQALVERNITHSHCFKIVFDTKPESCTITSSVVGFSNAEERVII